MQALSEQSWDLGALEPTVSWDVPGSYSKAHLHQIRSPALDLVFTELYHSFLEGDFSLKSRKNSKRWMKLLGTQLIRWQVTEFFVKNVHIVSSSVSNGGFCFVKAVTLLSALCRHS